MRLFSSIHVFGHPWESVSSANWIKYPSEITPHVVHVDYLSRSVDPDTGVLRTERLITCKQSAPGFIVRMLGGTTEAYVYEVSECNPAARSLTLKTKNLTFSNLMTIEETCKYAPSPSNPTGETLFSQDASIASIHGFWTIRNMLEDFGLERFRTNALKGKAALESAIAKLCQETKEAVEKTLNFCDAPAPLAQGAPPSSSAIAPNKVQM